MEMLDKLMFGFGLLMGFVMITSWGLAVYVVPLIEQLPLPILFILVISEIIIAYMVITTKKWSCDNE